MTRAATEACSSLVLPCCHKLRAAKEPMPLEIEAQHSPTHSISDNTNTRTYTQLFNAGLPCRVQADSPKLSAWTSKADDLNWGQQEWRTSCESCCVYSVSVRVLHMSLLVFVREGWVHVCVLWFNSLQKYILVPFFEQTDHIWHTFDVNIQATQLTSYGCYSSSIYRQQFALQGLTAKPRAYQLFVELLSPKHNSSDGIKTLPDKYCFWLHVINI